MSEWKVVTIDQVANIKSGKRLPKGHTLVQENTILPYVRLVDVTDGKIMKDNLMFLEANTQKLISRYIVKKGDVCLAIVGHTIGMVFQVDDFFDGANLTENAARITDFDDQILSQFLYYYLISKIGQQEIISRKVGSAQGKLPLYNIRSLPINLPPLLEQNSIAHILGTLDDKIELNRQMNQTLEAMAQALFKSWFADFDPVIDNVLAQGGDIPDELQVMANKRALVPQSKKLISKAPELAALFPSSFVFNETLGKWIPEGWGDTDLTECLETVSKTYNLKNVDEIIFLNTGDIEEGKFLHSNYSKTKGLPGQAKKSILEGDILYSEIRPKNKRFAYVYFDSSDYVVSTKLMVLRPKNEIDPLFYYQILKSESTLTELQFLAESRSGTFPQITYDTLKAIRFVLPKQLEILDNYTKVLRTNFERSIENQKQTETLTQLRDSLLPEMISGRVRVK